MSDNKKIPFNRPFIAGKELFYISQAVLSGQLAGDGKFTRLCQKWLEENLKARNVLLTPSCSAALEMSAILAEVEPGDEVIMPAYTFVSTANAFVIRGAAIRFVDIREDTMNIDEKLIEAAITDKTKAIVPVHYGGVGCEMDTIMEIAARHDLLVIEDAAQGVKASYRGRALGTIGHMGAFSFHETKNFISGEGGALVVNDERFIRRAEIIREKGTNRAAFFRGEVDKYTWLDIGSSYLPSEIIAAFLYAQLEEADEITKRRWQIHNYYAENLKSLEDQGLIRLPWSPPECEHNANMFHIILPDSQSRISIIDHLRKQDIHAVFHYVPLHTSPMGEKMGCNSSTLPVTENMSTRIVRLPCYFELEEVDQARIVEAIRQYFQ